MFSSVKPYMQGGFNQNVSLVRYMSNMHFSIILFGTWYSPRMSFGLSSSFSVENYDCLVATGACITHSYDCQEENVNIWMGVEKIEPMSLIASAPRVSNVC